MHLANVYLSSQECSTTQILLKSNPTKSTLFSCSIQTFLAHQATSKSSITILSQNRTANKIKFKPYLAIKVFNLFNTFKSAMFTLLRISISLNFLISHSDVRAFKIVSPILLMHLL